MRSKYKGLILYPLEDITHFKAIQYIKSNYKYALITHDKDLDTEGNLKKSHTHVVLALDNSQEDNTICNVLGISYNYLQSISSIKGSLEYLIHLNNPDKFQYSLDEVEGDLKNKLEDYLLEAIPEHERFRDLLDIIYKERPKNLGSLVRLCLDNGYYDLLKKNSYILVNIIKSY